ncbi:hypothetical protein ABZV65_19410 [Streptomyces bauhiniae]|uniref:hypothetical protein n=1 Tax=Streptomyces bauhiniae TaxID=2340725 RepID=UPI0033BE7AC8
MPDVTIKLSDGLREVTIEVSGSNDDPLARAEETAIRMYAVVTANKTNDRPTGFNGWALSSDTQRSDEE